MGQQRPAYAWQTDKGLVRTHNEDAVAVYSDAGLVIVADGIGGANAGDVASRLATEVIGACFRERPPPPRDRKEALRRVKAAVEEANRVVWEASQRTSRYVGMGTTLVLGFVGPDWLVFGHVGDSRIYRLRDGDLTQVTRDHSLIQEVVDGGLFPTLEDARRSGINEHVLTRALGTGDSVVVDMREMDLVPGDLFLFCTDGLTGMVSDEDLRRTLLIADQDLDRLPAMLVNLALEGGGLDNITVALMRVC
ncbi:MAG: PP2C family serine/threonine-protein phosphatase [Pseudomonadota bacterium]|nr:PP2C family serine/threonine-protein phosphatase [Pseudomonadota bacterium]